MITQIETKEKKNRFIFILSAILIFGVALITFSAKPLKAYASTTLYSYSGYVGAGLHNTTFSSSLSTSTATLVYGGAIDSGESSGTARVYVNGTLVSTFSLNGKGGSVHNIKVNSGNNSIKITTDVTLARISVNLYQP